MKTLFSPQITRLLFCLQFLFVGTGKAQPEWTVVPLPQGVQQIGSNGCTFLGAGGNYAYLSTDYGTHLWRASLGELFEPVPLPPGITQLGVNECKFEGAGGGNLSGPHFAYFSANFGTSLYRLTGSDHWSIVPLPPGISQIGANGVSFKGVGAYYACLTSNNGTVIHLHDGNNWSTIPMPPGITQFSDIGNPHLNVGLGLLATSNNGNELFGYFGQWTPLALPYTGFTLLSDSNDFIYSGYHQNGLMIFSSENNGTSLFQHIGGWGTLPSPPGVAQWGDSGSSVIGASGPCVYAVTNFGANLYVTINMVLSHEEKKAKAKCSILPNPGRETIFIKGEEKETLILCNQIGQEIRRIELNEQNNFNFAVSGLLPGLYFISGKNGQQKFVVME